MNPISDQDIDRLAEHYGSDFQPDVAVGLARLKARTRPGAAVRSIGRRRWLGVAASFLVLISAGTLAYGAFFGATTVVNEGDQPMVVALMDGTEVWLQQDSELRYDRTFNEEDRRVALRGQAYFEVHPDKSRPFLINGGPAQLRVTGTAFNLRMEGEEMEVEVSEGSVTLTGQNNRVAVTQKKRGVVTPAGEVILLDAPDLNRHAWRLGKMTFDNTPLREVLHTIRDNFRVEIVLEGNEDFPISGTFPANNPADILTAVAKLGGGKLDFPTNESGVFRLYGM